MLTYLIFFAVLFAVAKIFKFVPLGLTVFEYTSYGKVDLLSARLRQQQWWGNKFAYFVAPNFVKAVDKSVAVTNPGDPPQFTGAPVEVFEEFVTMGQTDMRIPVEQRLTGMPVYGDMPLIGTEESQAISWRRVKINRTRKAEKIPTGMSKQIMKKYADSLVTGAERKLTTWWGQDYIPGNIIMAMLCGYSQDLIYPTAKGGRAVSVMSHPNFLVAGNGFVAYTAGRPGTAAYEASVEAALDGLTSDDTFSVALLQAMSIEAPRKKIKQIVFKDGFSFYPVFCSDAQWYQLMGDPDFKDVMKRIPESLAKNPLGNGALAYVYGCAIYPDLKLWGARTHNDDANVTADTVEYGPTPTAAERAAGMKSGNWMTQLDQNTKKLAILIGASALSVGVGERLQLKDDVQDYENRKGVGVDTIQSILRSDIFDEDGMTGLTAGDFQENTSSMVIATYSPQNIQYSGA